MPKKKNGYQYQAQPYSSSNGYKHQAQPYSSYSSGSGSSGSGSGGSGTGSSGYNPATGQYAGGWANTSNNTYYTTPQLDNDAGTGPSIEELMALMNGGGRPRGGGGGGGGPTANYSAMYEALQGYKPQQYEAGTVPQYQDSGLRYEAADFGTYDAPEFYDFDTGTYDRARLALADGLTADRAAATGAYGDAMAELAALYADNPYAGREFTQAGADPNAQTQALLSQYGGSVDTSGGMQADRAFQNVMGLNAAATQQRQAAEQRALSGDERRRMETLGNQGRMMGHQIEMQQARALEQYNKDKWMYGEQVARYNYENNIRQQMHNNEIANQNVGLQQNAYDQAYGSNVAQYQANQAAANANVDLANQTSATQLQAIIDMLSQGANIPTSIPQGGS